MRIAMVGAVCLLAVVPLVAGDDGFSIWRPTVIERPGKYVVTRNLTAEPGQIAIWIASSNVNLDLNGFTIRGSDVSAILALGGENITIRNGTIIGGSIAVNLDQNRNVVVEDLMISSPSSGGIRANSVGFAIRRNHIKNTPQHAVVGMGTQGTIEDNVIDDARFGIEVVGSRSVAILNNRISTTQGEAISLEICNGCIVAGNTVQDAEWGIVLLPANGSKIYDNVFEGLLFDGIFVADSAADNLILENVVTGARRGLWMTGSRNHIERNVLNATTTWGLHFGFAASDNTYGRNTAKGSPGSVCGGVATTDFCDEGTGNDSFGDNFMPDLR